jgi:hypothetical protein
MAWSGQGKAAGLSPVGHMWYHGKDGGRDYSVKVLSPHHDIGTATGGQVVLFTRAKSPMLGDTMKKWPFRRGR